MCAANIGVLAAEHQLQDANAAEEGVEAAFGRESSPFAVLKQKAIDVGVGEAATIEPGGELAKERGFEFGAASDDAGGEHFEPLPCSAKFVEALDRAAQRRDEARGLGLDAEGEVDRVRRRVAAGEEGDNCFGDAVGFVFAGGGGVFGGAVGEGVVEEEELERRVEVHKASAAVAEGEEEPLAVGGGVMAARRAALCDFERGFAKDFGELREVFAGAARVGGAGEEAIADAEDFAIMNSAEGVACGAFAAGRFDFTKEVGEKGVAGDRLALHDAEQIEALDISEDDVSESSADGEDAQEDRQGVGIAFEEGCEREGAADLFEVTQEAG